MSFAASKGRPSGPSAVWLEGAAPAFDEAVLRWLRRSGLDAIRIGQQPKPPVTIPLLTRLLRVSSYARSIEAWPRTPLVLPYLAGDALLLAGVKDRPTLGVALGSDVWLRLRTRRHETLFRAAIARLDALWAVSEALADELATCGRIPDWVAPVGVAVETLPPVPTDAPDRGRIFSARNDSPVYRQSLIRAAVGRHTEWVLVEPRGFSCSRMYAEMLRAEVVVSLPITDGAPATIMEALCLGAHVVASGGATVRDWIDRFGGTYGEPHTAGDVLRIIEKGIEATRRTSRSQRLERALRARERFSRDAVLQPLLTYLTARNTDPIRRPFLPPR
jgi:hypothetical protein